MSFESGQPELDGLSSLGNPESTELAPTLEICVLTVARQTMTHSGVCRWRPTGGWPAAVAANLKG